MHNANTSLEATEILTKKKRYDRQLTTSAICLALVFLLSLLPYATPQNISWHEIKSWSLVAVPVVLSSFAFVHLLPVLIRGAVPQRISAFILLILAGYFAFQYWEIVLEDVISR